MKHSFALILLGALLLGRTWAEDTAPRQSGPVGRQPRGGEEPTGSTDNPAQILNVPIDVSGTVKGAEKSHRAAVIELLSEPVPLTGTEAVFTNPFPVAGAQIVGLRLHVSDYSGDTCFIRGAFQWRWRETDEFFEHTLKDFRLPPFIPGTSISFPEATVYLIRGQPTFESPVFLFPQGPQGRVALYKFGECVPTIDSVAVLVQ